MVACLALGTAGQRGRVPGAGCVQGSWGNSGLFELWETYSQRESVCAALGDQCGYWDHVASWAKAKVLTEQLGAGAGETPFSLAMLSLAAAFCGHGGLQLSAVW